MLSVWFYHILFYITSGFLYFQVQWEEEETLFTTTQIAGPFDLDDQNGLVGDINDDAFTFLCTDGTERTIALGVENVIFNGKDVVITGVIKSETTDRNAIPVIRISTLETAHRDLLSPLLCDCC